MLLLDLPRYAWALVRGGDAYLALCNRSERLQRAPDGSGYCCDWRWTSDLHAPKIIPALGKKLMRRAMARHPIGYAELPSNTQGVVPQVSFIIGHRGMARLPHLLATLRSIAAQQGVTTECIVVEQDVEPQLAGCLPEWVRHIHTPPPTVSMPYCRSWTFNVGAKQARGELLVLHDNDMLIPVDYASKLVEVASRGHDVINLKRFIFYMSERHTHSYFAGTADLVEQPPEAITQNLEGGGSVAIGREAYHRIGGMDERFIGWGGEDNEFWERAQTLRVWPYANLSLWHLWHAAQPGKFVQESETLQRLRTLSNVAVQTRIARLKEMPTGALSGPVVGEQL